MYSARVTLTPDPTMFGGHTAASVHTFVTEIRTEVAGQASADVHLILNQDIRKPTPYYETQIRTEMQGNDMVVHDSGVIYGDWLEGTSSRNARSRFKGYHAFRRTELTLRSKVPGLVVGPLRRFLSRMNS